MSDLIIIAFICCLACSYLVRFLLLEKVDEFEGPFKSSTMKVFFPEKIAGDATYPPHYQAVSFQDRIRWIFGVYKINGDIWEIKWARAEMWMCYFCLIFWVALPFSAFVMYLSGMSLIVYPVIHLAMCKIVLVIYERI